MMLVMVHCDMFEGTTPLVNHDQTNIQRAGPGPSWLLRGF